MRGHCIICAELFVATSDISAITCGHTFHLVCLAQWMERSKSCPQCRIKLNAKSVIQKLYFDAGPDLEPEEDPDVLRNRNNELETEVRKIERELKGLRDILDGQFDIVEQMEKETCKTQTDLKREKDLTASLKIQLECLSTENKRTKQLEKEVVKLNNQLKDCKNMEAILNGSDEEAKEILRTHGRGSLHMDQLARYCGVLKSELTTTSTQKQRLVTKRKHLELEKSRLEKDLCHVHEALVLKDQTIQLLEEKLKNEEKKNKDLVESSAPQRRRNVVDHGVINLSSSPSASGMPQLSSTAFGKENDSPAVARCSTAASIAMAKDKMLRSTHAAQTKLKKPDHEAYKHFSIMNKKPTLSFGKSSLASGSFGQGYDGMGGHSRPDVFPEGTTQAKRKVKVALDSKVARLKRSNTLANTIIVE